MNAEAQQRESVRPIASSISHASQVLGPSQELALPLGECPGEARFSDALIVVVATQVGLSPAAFGCYTVGHVATSRLLRLATTAAPMALLFLHALAKRAARLLPRRSVRGQTRRVATRAVHLPIMTHALAKASTLPCKRQGVSRCPSHLRLHPRRLQPLGPSPR